MLVHHLERYDRLETAPDRLIRVLGLILGSNLIPKLGNIQGDNGMEWHRNGTDATSESRTVLFTCTHTNYHINIVIYSERVRL